MYLFLLHLLI